MKYVNLVGILVLVGLSAAQWRQSLHLQLQVQSLEQTRLQQEDQIAGQKRAIAGLNSDLEEFRTRLAQAGERIDDLRKQMQQRVAERDAMQQARDGYLADLMDTELKLENWEAALVDRDAALASASSEIQKLSGERNQVIAKFNDLAGKYNDLVKKRG